MKSYTREELEEKYKHLPPEIEEAIFNVGLDKTLEEIGKKYKLRIDQLGILANETRLVMLGLTHPKDFINNLAERLELNEETAKNIAQEINQRIFHEIREELKKMHSINEAADSKLKTLNQKFKIQDLKKKLIEPTRVIEPPPTEPAEKPKIPATPFEYKLKNEEAVRAPLEEIKIPAEQKPPDKKYSAGDPYREPLE
ncbi:MAG: hypothetical protein AAB564_02385 [Patescibacteria group bacterium]